MPEDEELDEDKEDDDKEELKEVAEEEEEDEEEEEEGSPLTSFSPSSSPSPLFLFLSSPLFPSLLLLLHFCLSIANTTIDPQRRMSVLDRDPCEWAKRSHAEKVIGVSRKARRMDSRTHRRMHLNRETSPLPFSLFLSTPLSDSQSRRNLEVEVVREEGG